MEYAIARDVEIKINNIDNPIISFVLIFYYHLPTVRGFIPSGKLVKFSILSFLFFASRKILSHSFSGAVNQKYYEGDYNLHILVPFFVRQEWVCVIDQFLQYLDRFTYLHELRHLANKL